MVAPSYDDPRACNDNDCRAHRSDIRVAVGAAQIAIEREIEDMRRRVAEAVSDIQTALVAYKGDALLLDDLIDHVEHAIARANGAIQPEPVRMLEPAVDLEYLGDLTDKTPDEVVTFIAQQIDQPDAA